MALLGHSRCLCSTHLPATVQSRTLRYARRDSYVRKASSGLPDGAPEVSDLALPQEGPSTDLKVILRRFKCLALPYWNDPGSGGKARWALAGVIALTLATTGVSVLFNFLGRDFFNALSDKDEPRFWMQLKLYLGAFGVGIPVFVLRDYYQSLLSLEWRAWMTQKYIGDYLGDKTFYRMQAGGTVDNPDQRITADISGFTGTALGLGITLLNAVVDLVSFSNIMFSIYPPLFAVLVAYAAGGTGISLALGKPLVGLNFLQEAREADLRYALVRLRENSESIAFYKGEESEQVNLGSTLAEVVANFQQLLKTSRKLDFFTSFYRFCIQLLPAAVVAPMFFQGKVPFGVVNQSQSAFSHILTDVSLIVYQFESLAGFSATIDRLGEFVEVVDNKGAIPPDRDAANLAMPPSAVTRTLLPAVNGSPGAGEQLLSMQDLTLCTPDFTRVLVRGLDVTVAPGDSLLVMGPSGSGKTSLLRALAGLWTSGSGEVAVSGRQIGETDGAGEVFFVPQRTYTVLGDLRQNLLYPKWRKGRAETGAAAAGALPEAGADPGPQQDGVDADPVPSDEALVAVLRAVRLDGLLDRCCTNGDPASALDVQQDWSSGLSMGELQRLAFARVLLARPRLVLMDEITSALDVDSETAMYELLREADVTYVSIGHRPTLKAYHARMLTLSGMSPEDWSLSNIDAQQLSTDRISAC